MNPLRRHFAVSLPAFGALVLGARHSDLLAQTTPAGMEAVAPPLPTVGAKLALPEVALFDGTVFMSEQARCTSRMSVAKALADD
jgi:hypothetical protein